MANELRMPQLGESIMEGTIVSWLKQVGQAVKEFDPLLEVETDKVTVEVTSPFTGVLLHIIAPEGTVAKRGELIAYIGAANEQVSIPTTVPTTQSVQESAPPPSVTVSPVAARMAAEHAIDLEAVKGSGTGGRITKKDLEPFVQAAAVRTDTFSEPSPLLISPIVGRLAAEHGLDLRHISGTGTGGRVTKQDVLDYLQQHPERSAISDQRSVVSTSAASNGQRTATPANDGDIVPLNSMRRAIAEHMVRSKHTSPHVTTVMEVDMNTVSQHRAAHKAEFAAKGVNLTFTPYFVLAVAAALTEHPLVNASWDEGGIRLHRQINIGMATALDNNGLIVPVLKNVDEKSLLGVAREVNELAERARAGRLSPDEVSGGTFSITNHGTSGSLFATPIINQPQAAILGVGKIIKRPVVIHDAIAIRPMVYLSLTFDHRILDGAGADHFLSSVQTALETWQL